MGMLWRFWPQLAAIGFWLLLLFFGLVVLINPALLQAQAPDSPPPDLQVDLPWSIHLYAVPSSPPSGTGLFAFTGKTPNICQNGEVTFNAERVGQPAPFEGEYKEDDQIYSGFLDNFFPDGISTYIGKLSVVCALANGDRLTTNPIIFWRYYYPRTDINVLSDDNLAELSLNESSLANDHSIIVMSTNALPGPTPAEVAPIGLPYSFRASGATIESLNDMLLNLFYQETFLGAADPLTLRIFEWDAANEKWLDAGDQNLSAPISGAPNVNKPARKFTTYILVSTPRWLDSFSSSVGLETRENITRNLVLGLLELDSNALSGSAISKAYTPTLPIQAWQTVSYTANIPAGTNLSVSVLSRDGQLLKENVSPGQSLADIDPETHPSLKLRLEMSTTSAGASPQLLDWSLKAEPKFYQVYLPLLVK